MKKFLYAAMVVLVVFGVAPAASAAEVSADTTIIEDTIDTVNEVTGGLSARTQVPFSVTRTIPGTSAGTAAGTTDTGFVGVCDPVLQCYGFSLRLSRTAGSANVGPTSVSLKGVICVRDFSAPCGSATSAGTGVIITDRTIAGPTASVTTPAISGRVCLWVGDPRFGGSCPTDALISDVAPITRQISTPAELQGLVLVIPERLVVETP